MWALQHSRDSRHTHIKYLIYYLSAGVQMPLNSSSLIFSEQSYTPLYIQSQVIGRNKVRKYV